MEIKEIAKIYTDFPDKFGLPRQSLLVEGLLGKIVFEKDFRNADSLRGLEEYSHIWLIWGFSKDFASSKKDSFHPTVRPPRLGGNERVGVFATRSPNRPNPIGMSLVKIVSIDLEDEEGPIIYVDGIDMVSGTPIYDIKPYGISDCVVDAKCGFADKVKEQTYSVKADEDILSVFPKEKQEVLLKLLAQNPAPSYQNDKDRIYGFSFAGHEVKFSVDGNAIILKDII